MSDPVDDIKARIAVSEGSKAEGYPCPKDGAIMKLIEASNGKKGAWCPECHTLWTELAEVSLDVRPEGQSFCPSCGEEVGEDSHSCVGWGGKVTDGLG